jgi:hypothetical protein
MKRGWNAVIKRLGMQNSWAAASESSDIKFYWGTISSDIIFFFHNSPA